MTAKLRAVVIISMLSAALAQGGENQLPTCQITAPPDGALYVISPATIMITASATDPDGSVTRVRFYEGASGNTLLHTDTAAPWEYTWTNVTAGTRTIVAQARDNNNAWGPLSAPITVIVNAMPTASITSPANGAVYQIPANISISANASDSDGTIARVEFYVGTEKISEDDTAPYTAEWGTSVPGNYSLTAKAVDNRGAVTTSSAVTIKVNNPPSVSVTAPTPGTIYNTPANISITASASDTDGTIVRVEFYGDGNFLGSDDKSPYTWTWSGVTSGGHIITARAFDNDNAQTVSTAVSVHVNYLPTISLTNPPAQGAIVQLGSNAVLTADASDSDGTIAQVDFYRGGTTLIDTDTTEPYSVTWSNPPAGTYSITARATDNRGQTATSSAHTLIVNQQPTASITAPANGAVFVVGQAITITASASDADDSVSKVEFYDGAALLFTDTVSPWSYVWPNAPNGNHTLTVKAYDTRGGITTSSAVNIYVNIPPSVSVVNPEDNDEFYSPATILLKASAADSDGTVAAVSFYRGGSTLIGNASYNPATGTWDFTWNNVADGIYSITARATDDRGTVTTSSAISIEVVTPPSVTLVTPTEGTLYNEPASVSLSAATNMKKSRVARMEFYANNILVAQTSDGSNYPYYNATWNNVPWGNYGLVARVVRTTGQSYSSSPPINIHVNAVPVAYNQDVVADKNTPLAVTLQATDADNDTLVYAIISGPNHGILEGSGANRTYTPATNYAGSDAFTFRVTDHNGFGVSNTATVNIHVNEIPVAYDDAVITDQNLPLDIVLRATDADNDPLTYVIIAGPSHGTLEGTGANRLYTPNFNYLGDDVIVFRVTDHGPTGSNTATLSIHVNAIPTVQDQHLATDEDTPLDIVLTAADADSDALTYVIVSGPSHGVLQGSGANRTYIPDKDYFGADSFTFKVTDHGPTGSNIATVFITVNPVNDLPLAEDQQVNTDEDTPKAIVLTAQHPENENQTLIFEVVTPPQYGVLSGTAPNLVYTPDQNYNGQDSFTFRAFDGIGYGNTATVTINIAPVNDPPVIESIFASPERGLAPLEVFFSAWATDVDSSNLYYHWDFGDEESSEAQNPTHVYTAPGTYTVTLTVTDSGTPLPALQAQAQIKIWVLVPVMLKGLDQNSDRVPGAQIWVSGYDAWYAEGSIVGLPVDEVVDFKGMMLDAEGSLGSTTILANATEIVVPFQKVTFVAKDQYDAPVPGAQIYVGVYDADPFPTGTYITLPVGATVSALGYVNNKLGPKKSLPIISGVEECVVDFWKATLLCKDQNNNDVPSGRFAFPGATGSPYAHGTQVVFPKGILLRANAVNYGITGPQMSILYKDEPSFTAQFWTLMIRCRDQFDVPAPSGVLILSNNTTFGDSSVASFPRGATVSARAKRANLVASVYDSYLMNTGLDAINAKFRSIVFNAVATNGSTLVPGAQIEIFGSGLPRFANATAQVVPYNITLSSVRVYNSSNVLIANRSFSVTANTDILVIVTSWVAP